MAPQQPMVVAIFGSRICFGNSWHAHVRGGSDFTVTAGYATADISQP